MTNVVAVDFRNASRDWKGVSQSVTRPAPIAHDASAMLDFGRQFVKAHAQVRALQAECHKLIASTSNLGESARAMSRAVAKLQGALDCFREAAIGDIARNAILEAMA
ncbi:MAG: hypothetical protein Tsb008_19130 [Rhodothalassiaceae bacterium]